MMLKSEKYETWETFIDNLTDYFVSNTETQIGELMHEYLDATRVFPFPELPSQLILGLEKLKVQTALPVRIWKAGWGESWILIYNNFAEPNRDLGTTVADMRIFHQIAERKKPYCRMDPSQHNMCTLYIPTVLVWDGSAVIMEVNDLKNPPNPNHINGVKMLFLHVAYSLNMMVLGSWVKGFQQALQDERAKLFYAQENERKLIALEVHDVISQRAAAIFYRLQTCEYYLQKGYMDQLTEQVEDLCRVARVLVDDTTRLLFNLNPPHLEELGLEASVRRYLDQYRREYRINVDLEWQGPSMRFDGVVELGIYRIIQEALANVQKHAHCKNVQVRLKVSKNSIEGIVADDGVGFDLASVRDNADKKKSFGLFGMKERAKLLGGHLEIVSMPGQGTVVRFVIQLGDTAAVNNKFNIKDQRGGINEIGDTSYAG